MIGAGSAGLWAATSAARLGARVALIEKEHIGGDCTNYGCIPSKALLKAARVASQLRTAERFGLDRGTLTPVTVDLERVMAGVRRAIDRVAANETPEALSREGVDVYLGSARFDDPHTIVIDPSTRLRPRHVLICTGARPSVPDIPGLRATPFWTYHTVWQQRHVPERLLVIGSGPVGTELTQAFARFGSQVTVFERGDRPLRVADPDASAVLRDVLEKEGVRFRVDAHVERVAASDGRVRVTDRGEDIEGDAMLVAVGRRPVVDGLALERAGVAYSERGIQVNDRLQTSQQHIYACGDVVGGFQFTHYAAWQASMAVRTMLFPGGRSGVLKRVPWTVFTEPEIAQCGLSEAEARAAARQRDDVQVTRWGLDRVDRAVTDGDLDGFIKVVHRPNGQILGAQIVAARAGDMIEEFALAIDHRLKLADLASTMHVYPTYAIGVQQLAAETLLDRLGHNRLVQLARRAAALRRS